jgi:Pyridoxamine 5'-phosphate oxidase
MNKNPIDSDDQAHQKQVELAQGLLKTVRHAAYATINEDGTPHNSPLMLIYNEDLTRLYIGSYSDSLHVKNLLRTGKTFAVIFDSFTKDQGGVYITGINPEECTGDNLIEALRVHNVVRTQRGSQPIDIGYYQNDKPSQRMYSIDIAKIEVYSFTRNDSGLINREARIEVSKDSLLKNTKHKSD